MWQNLDLKQHTHEQLAAEVEELANEITLPSRCAERGVVLAMAKLIKADGLVQDSIDRLAYNLSIYDRKANSQAKMMIWLSVGIGALTFILVVGLGVQIWLAVRS